MILFDALEFNFQDNLTIFIEKNIEKIRPLFRNSYKYMI